MSDQHIDAIARAAAGRDRRAVLKSLGAAALGAAGLVAVRGAAAADAATADDRDNDLEQCIDRCRDGRCSDVANPNRCLNRCKDRCRKRLRK